MSGSFRRLIQVLLLAGVLVPVLLIAVPSAQAATVCDVTHPCLPQNLGFSSTITNGGAGAFVCSNVSTAGSCLLGQATNGSTNGVNGVSAGGAGV
jgi:hypothetical protein